MAHRPAFVAFLAGLLVALPLAAVATGPAEMAAPPAGPLLMPAPLGPAPAGNSVMSSLPDMGSGANAIISRAEEYQIGRMMVKNLRDEGQILDDPEVSEYIQSVGMRIASHAQEDQRFNFFVVRDRSVNAFATPGGFIGVHAGLLLLSANESELAGVLAHESGHVTQRHIARAVQAQGRQGLATLAAMLGAVLIGAITGGGGDVTAGMIAMAQGAQMQAALNFSRMEEQEADRVGIGYLAAAGFDSTGMASFFESMGRLEGLSGQYVPELLRTHPMSTNRIAEARGRAQQFPRVQHQDSAGYALIRERVRVLTAPSGTDLRGYYAQALKQERGTRGYLRLGLRYGAALAELEAGDAKQAARDLQELVEENQGLTILHAALGQAQMAAGDGGAALETFAHAARLFPRNVPIAVRYGESLIEAGKPAEAHALLLDVFNNTPPTPGQIHLTALAASAAGDTGDAYFYMCEYHIASGDLMLATQQLELALAAPRLTEVQRKRYQARLDEIRTFLREQRRPRATQTGSEEERRPDDSGRPQRFSAP